MKLMAIITTRIASDPATAAHIKIASLCDFRITVELVEDAGMVVDPVPADTGVDLATPEAADAVVANCPRASGVVIPGRPVRTSSTEAKSTIIFINSSGS